MNGRRLVLAAAIAALAALFVLGAIDFPDLIQGWFIASLFWVQLPLGALMMRLITRLTGGERQAGAMAALSPALSLTPWIWLLVPPIAVSAPMLFPRGGVLANPMITLAGTIVVLAGWTVLWRVISRPFGQAAAGVGLVFHALALTFIGFDWVQALSAHWITGDIAMTLAGWQILAGSAGAVLAAPRHPDVVRDDYAGGLVGGVITTGYFGFMSYMVVWYGDIPDTASWYLPRVPLAWSWMAGAAALLGIAGVVCVVGPGLRRLAAWLCLAGLWLYLLWWIAPSFGAGAIDPAFLATVFIGCVGRLLAAPRQAAPRRTT
jgi:hypothetical protein